MNKTKIFNEEKRGAEEENPNVTSIKMSFNIHLYKKYNLNSKLYNIIACMLL